jgi:hypothetical protein
MTQTRFSYVPGKFVPKLDVLDDLQNAAGTPPNVKKYLDWHWTVDESNRVSQFRIDADAYWAQIITDRHCPPEVKDLLKVQIKDFMAYDHGKTEPHKLLDKIADFGTLLDCELIGIKRGTPLAKLPSKGSKEPVTKRPVISIRYNIIGEQMLNVTDSDAPESKAKPKGIKSVRVYYYIGVEPPTSYDQYKHAGNASRGLFLNTITDPLPEGQMRVYIWFISCYESNTGVMGGYCAPEKCEVLVAIS